MVNDEAFKFLILAILNKQEIHIINQKQNYLAHIAEEANKFLLSIKIKVFSFIKICIHNRLIRDL